MSYTRDTIANCVSNMNYLQQKNKLSRCLLRCKRGGSATSVWNNLAICGDYNGSLCVCLWQFRYRGNRRLYDNRHWLAVRRKLTRISSSHPATSHQFTTRPLDVINYTAQLKRKTYSCLATLWAVLQEHLRRHTGETPYHCPDCPQRFKTRNTFKRHLRTRHGEFIAQWTLIASQTL